MAATVRGASGRTICEAWAACTRGVGSPPLFISDAHTHLKLQVLFEADLRVLLSPKPTVSTLEKSTDVGAAFSKLVIGAPPSAVGGAAGGDGESEVTEPWVFEDGDSSSVDAAPGGEGGAPGGEGEGSETFAPDDGDSSSVDSGGLLRIDDAELLRVAASVNPTLTTFEAVGARYGVATVQAMIAHQPECFPDAVSVRLARWVHTNCAFRAALPASCAWEACCPSGVLIHGECYPFLLFTTAPTRSGGSTEPQKQTSLVSLTWTSRRLYYGEELTPESAQRLAARYIRPCARDAKPEGRSAWAQKQQMDMLRVQCPDLVYGLALAALAASPRYAMCLEWVTEPWLQLRGKDRDYEHKFYKDFKALMQKMTLEWSKKDAREAHQRQFQKLSSLLCHADGHEVTRIPVLPLDMAKTLVTRVRGSPEWEVFWGRWGQVDTLVRRFFDTEPCLTQAERRALMRSRDFFLVEFIQGMSGSRTPRQAAPKVDAAALWDRMYEFSCKDGPIAVRPLNSMS